MSSSSEPRNPLYLLLLLASLLFVVTALAYAIIPMVEDRAKEQGVTPPPSAFRATLRRDGWKWLLGELAGMIVLGIASMALDRHRLRRLQNASAPATMPPQSSSSPSAPQVDHENPGSADRGTDQAD
jgi:hypothetical protein